MKARTIGILLSFLFSVAANASSDINPREGFRKQLEEYATEFNGQSRSSLCVSWSQESGMQNANYSFKITDNSKEYVNSFFLHFVKEGRLDFVTLIAYEGHNGYLMGTLSTQEDDKFKVYEHTFHGYLTDKVRLEINKLTGGVSVDFYKENHGVLLYSLECSPTVGI